MKETKGLIAEFKEFISRGNVLDMAVGIIIGAAFTAIVTSLVNDIIMPIVGVIIGGIDFSSLHQLRSVHSGNHQLPAHRADSIPSDQGYQQGAEEEAGGACRGRACSTNSGG